MNDMSMAASTATDPPAEEPVAESADDTPRPLWSPYLAGVALGLVLLGTYVVFGRGLGASGALTRFASWLAHAVAPGWVERNAHLSGYWAEGSAWWGDFLIFQAVGVALGGLFAALTARRLRFMVERGPRISARTRLVTALVGGAISGVGARLAQGCTSGQALSGGATLALGSWAFMFAVFGGAYALAYFVRRLWT